MAVPIYIPTSGVVGFFFHHTLSIICYFVDFIGEGHSDRCEVISHCSFDLHSILTDVGWYLIVLICFSLVISF